MSLSEQAFDNKMDLFSLNNIMKLWTDSENFKCLRTNEKKGKNMVTWNYENNHIQTHQQVFLYFWIWHLVCGKQANEKSIT